jgi:ATP phosphoribosyltransferase regulatory subunit
MRDLLPPKARLQSRVGSRMMRSFELFGYERVWLPTFEYADVLQRTNSGVGSALRFVEPDSGEIVALRADMTPQIARVVSTRYKNAPLPARLCYQGSVLRRRRERARTESQVVQAGIELVGHAGLEADFEVLMAMCSAVKTAGLRHFVLDIGHAGIADSLLALVQEQARPGLNEALSAKDTLVLERRGRAAGLSGKDLTALVALAELHGGQAMLGAAVETLRGTAAERCGMELRQLCERVLDAGISPGVVVDFGETNRFDYYTGPMFQILARGPGEPLASGGRYDNLYPRFGLQRSAAGCALDLNNVCWALETAGWVEPSFPKLAVGCDTPQALLSALREQAIACAVSHADLAAYADAWGFDFTMQPANAPVVRARTGAVVNIAPGSFTEQAQQIANFIKQQREPF